MAAYFERRQSAEEVAALVWPRQAVELWLAPYVIALAVPEALKGLPAAASEWAWGGRRAQECSGAKRIQASPGAIPDR